MRYYVRTLAIGAGLALIVAPLTVTLWACSNSSSSSSAQPVEPPGSAVATGGPDGAGDGLAAVDKDREKRLAQVLTQVLEKQHLRRQALDDTISEKAFKLFLEQIDFGKTFLLQSHADQLERHVREMDDQMKRGRLTLAHESAAIFSERLKVVQGMVDGILAKPFDLTIDESVQIDPDKRAFSKTDEELEERWRKILKLQVLVRVARMEEIARSRAEAEEKAKEKAKKEAGKAGKKARKKAAKKAATEVAEKSPDEAGESPGSAAAQDEEIPTTTEGREAKVRKEIAENYRTRFTRLAQEEHIDRLDRFVNAMTAVYDPHTAYLPPQRKENFDIQMSGQLEGIGALLGEDEHYIRVSSIVPGSASWRQGQLEAGDLILAVAQGSDDPVDIGDMRLRDVVQLIRGKKGTVVKLTVQKSDNNIQIIPITRDVVQIEATYAKGAIIEHKEARQKVGYIYLPSFYGDTRSSRGSGPERSCTEDVRTLLDAFTARGVEAAIIDLRSNGGGLLSDARDMSGLFIETGPIVQTQTVDGNREVLEDRDPSIAFRGRTVILVDRFSASAAEILAAALQDYGRAVVVGTGQTHGKGTVQVLASLDELIGTSDDELPLGVVKLTRMQFFRINGESTQHRGVVPDIVLPDLDAHVESGERYLEHTIPWSKVDALPFSRWPNASWSVADLVRRSKERQAGNQAFNAVERHNEIVKARQDQTTHPLSLAAWQAKRDAEAKELEAAGADASKWPASFAVSIVDYDGSAAKIMTPRPNRKDSSDSASENGGRNRNDVWKDNLARDPWINESVFILRDMAGN